MAAELPFHLIDEDLGTPVLAKPMRAVHAGHNRYWETMQKKVGLAFTSLQHFMAEVTKGHRPSN